MSSTAPPPPSSSTGSAADLPPVRPASLTATIEDAAGNTVTSDNSTVSRSRRTPAQGPSAAPATPPPLPGSRPRRSPAHLAGSVTMEATAAGLTTGTLGDFRSFTARPHRSRSPARPPTSLRRDPSRAATIQDAAGNTVTADNSTVISLREGLRRRHRLGTGNATAVRRRRDQDDLRHSPAQCRWRQPPPDYNRRARRVYRRPRRRGPDRAHESGATSSGDNHPLTATIQDAAGNTVTTDNWTSVAFAKTSGAGTVTGTGNATASAGVATKASSTPPPARSTSTRCRPV